MKMPPIHDVDWLFLIAWRGFAINDEGVPFFTLEAGPSLYMVVAAGATLVGASLTGVTLTVTVAVSVTPPEVTV